MFVEFPCAFPTMPPWPPWPHAAGHAWQLLLENITQGLVFLLTGVVQSQLSSSVGFAAGENAAPRRRPWPRLGVALATSLTGLLYRSDR